MADYKNKIVNIHYHLPKEKEDNGINNNDRNSKSAKGAVGSLLGIILLVIILLNIPSLVAGNGTISDYFSFHRFMSMLENVPKCDFTWINDVITTIVADWGVFNFLRDFINVLIKTLSGVTFICVGLGQVVLFLVYFIPFIFGV